MKNTIDKQIIKALTIGISASMSLQSMTVQAADIDIPSDPSAQTPGAVQ